MELTVNGKKLEVTDGATIAALLEELQINPLRVAVQLNQQIAKRELKRNDDWWVDKSHVNYFNYESLFWLLDKHGFEIQQVYATYPMEMFLLQGDNYIGNKKLGRQVHARRKKFEMAMYQSEQGRADLAYLLQAWARCGMGRDLVVMAAKR